MANFTIVPAALLRMRDNDGVIRAQLPTAAPLLVCTIALIQFLWPAAYAYVALTERAG